MKISRLAAIVLTALASSPLFGQSLEELTRRLAEKEAENQRLRERIEMLEREVTPRRIKQSTRPLVIEDQGDSNRALERALVREGGLLLSAGRFEAEANFVYSHRNDALSGVRRSAFGPGLSLRAGLPWRSQLELAVPYVFERRRDNGISTRSDGWGDLSLGLSHQILREQGARPSLIGGIAYLAATGRNTVFESATPIAHGSGFDALQASLTALKRVDPLVFFGTYSFIHNFPETRNGARIRPGNTHGLRFGTALATGPDTSLRAALNLSFFDKTRMDGVPLAGTDDPSALLELGGSVVMTESMALDVLVGAGLTRSAPDFRITVALPIRF